VLSLINRTGACYGYHQSLTMKERTKNPTVLDVAKLAGVGQMTVSRVLNNQPTVRNATKRRVQAAIRQLGYKRNEAARMLRGLPTMMIGFIVPKLSDSFFASCAQTVQHVARANGFMTLVAASEGDSEQEIEQAELMASRNVSGIIVATSTVIREDRLKQIQDSGVALVALDRPFKEIQTDWVAVDNARACEEATRHLLEHGHKNIAFLSYNKEVYSAIERSKGYAYAMQAAGYKPNITMDLKSDGDVENWLSQARAGKDRPTAILTMNHVMTYRVLRALRKARLSIPKDLALIGFNDFDLAPEFTPPITVVDLSFEEMAERAMMLLMDRINRKRDQRELPPTKIVVPATLVVRQSCGCIAK
jgi:LacI family transcriptional regulator